jgi:hypothetical protein
MNAGQLNKAKLDKSSRAFGPEGTSALAGSPGVAHPPLIKKGDFLNQSNNPRSAIALRLCQMQLI